MNCLETDTELFESKQSFVTYRAIKLLFSRHILADARLRRQDRHQIFHLKSSSPFDVHLFY